MSENLERNMSNSNNEELNLPDEFREKVIQTWGEAGKVWLTQLPDRISQYSDQWSVVIEPAVHKLNYNYVAPAHLADGQEAILKIGVPNPELLTEIDALRAYDGHKAVKLLESDREGGAILLERVVPGKPLSEVQPQDDEEATRIAAEVIRDLPVVVPEGHSFPTVVKWAQAFERIKSKEHSIPPEMIYQAEHYLQELEASKREEKLLHGDLHFENILLDDKRGWIAIDPKGVVGDPAYEAPGCSIIPLVNY